MAGAPNGNGAHTREVVLSQLIWAAGIVGTIATAVWGVAQWSVAREAPLAELREQLSAQQRALADQSKALEKLIAFMDRENAARMELAGRETKRREWCAAKALRPEHCGNLLSDAEIAALKR